MVTFEKTTVPETVRAPSAPNPFEDVFPLEEGKAVTAVLKGSKDDDTDDGKAIRTLVRQAREQAAKVEKSARVKIEYDAKAKKSTLTFWNVPKIERKRKADKDSDKSE